jgi:hypothetical protein
VHFDGQLFGEVVVFVVGHVQVFAVFGEHVCSLGLVGGGRGEVTQKAQNENQKTRKIQRDF